MITKDQMKNISSNERKGAWAQTFTGKQFWPLDPRPDEVNLIDIAHSLAQQPRFNGHSLKFYSIAQHSVLVSKIVHPSQALPALFHDASEAYTGDIISPSKKFLPPEFKQIEIKIENVIFKKFNIDPETVDHKDIKKADKIILVTEMRDVMEKPTQKWDEDGVFEPLAEKIIPLSPEDAEKLFLERYEELKNS